MNKLILLGLSLIIVQPFYQFGGVLECLKEDEASCTEWNYVLRIDQQEQWVWQCFPASTLVLSKGGPKPLSAVEVHDWILSYNKETGKSQFSEVIAWLHRNTEGYLEFEQIETEEGFTFLSSDSHNIGFEDNGKINFKFAESLQEGDQLISLGQSLTVVRADSFKEEQGLYSPITTLSNFYIFAQNANPLNLLNSPMILVHSLSQIDSPINSQSLVHHLLAFAGRLGLNEHQNQHQQNYLHAVSHLLRLGATSSTKHLVRYYEPHHLRGRSSNEKPGKRKQVISTLLTLNELFLKNPH